MGAGGEDAAGFGGEDATLEAWGFGGDEAELL